MRLPSSSFASPTIRRTLKAAAAIILTCTGAANQIPAQQIPAQQDPIAIHRAQIQNFLAQRHTANGTRPTEALHQALQQHAALRNHPADKTANLTAAWQPLGPTSITSAAYGNVTGRITALALDPNDTTGNTLYIGTTGGGVWKSTNAAGPLASITVTPLTDDLPIFTTGAIAAISIGALAMQPAPNPILLAGTGDPNDATDSYYGQGILRSPDNGLTWTLITSSTDTPNANLSFAGLSVAAIAFSTVTPTLTVAAFSTSPESTVVNAPASTATPGLYYSTDAGITWHMSTLYDGSQIVQQPQQLGTGQTGNAATSVVWNPIRKLFFAAIRSHGYYSSADGITWTRLTNQPGANLTTAICPVGVNGIGAATCPIFRGVITSQPTTGDLYALTVDSNNIDQGLWQDLCNASANTCSTSSPTFAHRIDNTALDTNNIIPQAEYNLTLAAVPSTTGTTLFAGTIDLYRCAIATNTSICTLRNTTNALNGCSTPAKVAPAQHAITALGGSVSSSALTFLGNDGGLWRSTDGVAQTGSSCAATDSTHFDNLNAAIGTGGSLAEVVGFAQDPINANILIAGLGANGSAATSAASTLTPWPQLSAGEGGIPAIDATTPTNWLITIGAGINLKQCTLGTSCTAANFTPPSTLAPAQVANDSTLIHTPTLLDPAFTSNILLATCRIWRGPASSSSTWSTSNAISPAFTNTATPCSSTSPLIRSIAAGGPSSTSTNAQLAGSQVLYAGIAGSLDGGANIGGNLFLTTTANITPTATSWRNISTNPVTNDTSNAQIFNPNGFDISAIAVDTHDPTGATVYVTIMGFSAAPHIYRSTDFGAHWLNISANLPNAPANSVIIDPNDANTLYVALDTGVYTTTAVTNCATTNCWSIFGTALPNSPIIALAAAPQLLTGDGRRGMLRAATYGRGIWQTPLLTAVSLAQPAITLSTTALTFASQQVSTQSLAQTITITSSGTSPVTFTTTAITGDFTITSNTCAAFTGSATLAVSATCTMQVAFAPSVTGPRSGLLTIYANVPTGQATVALSGTATTPPSITFNPIALTFAATIVNQTTAAQIITVNNTGGTTATLQIPTITQLSTDFAIAANTCSTQLGPSTACAISITFTPSASGTRSGTLILTDSAGIQTATLTGAGNAPATDTLSTSVLTFPQQQITTAATPQSITLANSGDVPLTLIAATLNSTDFTTNNTCGNSLAAHSTCAINITFIPTAIGTRSATLTIVDQFRAQTVALTGTGVAPPGVSLTPSSLTFGNTGVNLSTPAQTLTLTNNGGHPLTLTNITISPNFTIATNTCTSTLAINTACTLQVLFNPATPGTISGTLTLTDNAIPSTQTVNLSGTAIDFTFTPSGATTQTLTSGSSAVYPLLLTPLVTTASNVAFTCTGAPTNSLCTISPSAPTLGAITPITVTIQTGYHATVTNPFHLPEIILAFIIPALIIPSAFIRRRKQLLLTLITLAALTSLTACGAGRLIPCTTNCSTTNTTPTPSGIYNLIVSATSAGITHNVPLTLIVQ